MEVARRQIFDKMGVFREENCGSFTLDAAPDALRLLRAECADVRRECGSTAACRLSVHRRTDEICTASKAATSSTRKNDFGQDDGRARRRRHAFGLF
jgi:hypothetical protein